MYKKFILREFRRLFFKPLNIGDRIKYDFGGFCNEAVITKKDKGYSVFITGDYSLYKGQTHHRVESSRLI